MNGETEIHPGLDDYLARVRAALADLPAEELAEVLEDIEPHVTEVFGEPGDPVDRLGSPEDYAAELRAAGGYPPVEGPPPVSEHHGRGRFVFWAIGLTALAFFLAAFATRGRTEPLILILLCLPVYGPALWLVLAGRVNRTDLTELPEYRRGKRMGDSAVALLQPEAIAYLRSLRPAWGLARLIVLAVLFLVALDRGPGLAVFTLIVAGGLVWLAGRVKTNRRLLAITLPANAFVIGAALGLVIGATDLGRGGPVYVNQGYVGGGLTYGGRPLSNVYAVGADGRPIEEFYLYDETGTPITVDYDSCTRIDRSTFRNRFPLPRVTYVNGACEMRTDMPFVPLPPGGGSSSPTVSTTASPTVSGSVPPTASTPPSASVTAPPTAPVTPTK
ncbi:MAG TPA: hypothetical protein VM677_28580 [Actinokineospora sp.]|nr:hypothetical protein [Actinokineospora sp.]